MRDIDTLTAEIFWDFRHPLNHMLGLESCSKSEVRAILESMTDELTATGWIAPTD